MERRFSIALLLCLLLAPLVPVFAQSPAVQREIDEFVELLNRSKASFPDLDFATKPSPREVRAAARLSSAKGRELLAQARSSLIRKLEQGLARSFVDLGTAIDQNPTDEETYSRRRSLLIEFERLYKLKGLSPGVIIGVGVPSRHLPENIHAENEYAFCDKAITRLAEFYKARVELWRGVGSGSAGGGNPTEAEDETTANIGQETLPTSVRHELPSTTKTVAEPSPRAIRGFWPYFYFYFYWTFWLLAALALLGMVYHLKRGAAGLSQLSVSGRSLPDDYLELSPEELFKSSLSWFQRSKYSRALSGFRKVAASAHPERNKALYYAVLTLLRLDDFNAAVADLELVEKRSLSTDELYRLASSFEESEGLEQAHELYEAVQEKDETFRDVLHRLKLIEKKQRIHASANTTQEQGEGKSTS